MDVSQVQCLLSSYLRSFAIVKHVRGRVPQLQLLQIIGLNTTKGFGIRVSPTIESSLSAQIIITGSYISDVPTAAAVRQREADAYNQMTARPRSPSAASSAERWPLVTYDPPRVANEANPPEMSVLQREIESLRAENEELRSFGAADPPPYTEGPVRP